MQSPKLHSLAAIFAWPRIKIALIFTVVFGLFFKLSFISPLWSLFLRTGILALSAVFVFGVLERWPSKLPSWCARWVLQVVGVSLSMPLATYLIYQFLSFGDPQPFWNDPLRLNGFGTMAGFGMLLAFWVALVALFRQRDASLKQQAMAFELERSELQRQTSDARLHLLQAQVAPHFLFNTLANVQALVDAGSPRASTLLRSLIAYLRAAVPRLNEMDATMDQELQLVQAYLDLMYMRMPDRLQFALHVGDAVRGLRCPPMALLTLVENAICHGIDPCEEGGRIDVEVMRIGERCRVRVSDTGVGLQHGGSGLGTGLAMLKERLQLSFHNDVRVSLIGQVPHGACAELEFPAIGAKP